VSLPGLDELALQEKIADNRHDWPIIFITGHGDVPTSVRAMKAGAMEFFLKLFNADSLVRAVADGIERSRCAVGREAGRNEFYRRFQSLTARQRRVMGLLLSGMLNKQIAAQLEITEITLKAHRGQVMRKMRPDSLDELVKMADKLRDMTTDDVNGFHV
jgi:FixJ family two-component response regulator